MLNSPRKLDISSIPSVVSSALWRGNKLPLECSCVVLEFVREALAWHLAVGKESWLSLEVLAARFSWVIHSDFRVSSTGRVGSPLRWCKLLRGLVGTAQGLLRTESVLQKVLETFCVAALGTSFSFIFPNLCFKFFQWLSPFPDACSLHLEWSNFYSFLEL